MTKRIIQYTIQRKTLVRVHVKINPKASVLNKNCCRALIVNLQKVFYNSQASVGDRQYTIILFISTIFLPTILNYFNDRERGRHYYFVGAPQCPPHDSKILYYLNDRDEGRY